MTPSASFSRCTSYPGWYTPSSEVKNILHEQDRFRRAKHNRLPVRFSEFEHHYKIVIPVTGTSKEDIVICTHNDQMMIALKKQTLVKKGMVHRTVDRDYFYGFVSLPQDADVEFSSAELKPDRLEICLSRTENNQVNGDHQIIVY